MAEQLKNSLDNPTSTLASGIMSGATSFTVQSGHGARFPATGDFRVKLTDQTTDTLYELVICTSRAGDVLTVTRAAEGTTARAFVTGDEVDLVLSAAGLTAYITENSASDADLAAHEVDTTAVHGITDTSTLYRSGGTDVAVADGGTGASTAAVARTNLDVPSNTEAVLDTIVDAKGDLIVGTAADTVARQSIGLNDQVLTADSTQATGVKWAVAGGGISASLFDANTILKADTDDTPVALTMGASTVLTRLASGGIVAGSIADLQNLLVIGDPSLSVFGPTGSVFQTGSRLEASSGEVGVLSSGVPFLTAIFLRVGTVITSIGYLNGGTAAGTPTNYWFGIFSSALSPLRLTVDGTTTAWLANTAKVLALSSSYTVPTSGLYYVGIMVKATTVPNLRVLMTAGGGEIIGLAPVINGPSATTGLTTPASCPDPVGALTANTSPPYAWGL